MNSMLISTKDARLEVKTTQSAKDFLNQAAALAGLNLSSFIMNSAMTQARELLRDHTTIELSLEGQRNLAALLKSNTEPTESMKALRRTSRLEVRE